MTTKKAVSPETLPYRPCVGMAVFNRDGCVFIGRRADDPEQAEGAGGRWQMPQGGIDEGEAPIKAAVRELYEETNIRSIAVIAEAPGWITYDLPAERIGKAWNGRFRGQTQKWFAFRFEGDESEIDIRHPAGGHKPEFTAWRWERLEALPSLIVPFKRPVYQQVVAAFRGILPDENGAGP